MLNYRYAAIDQGTTGTRVVVFEETGYSYSPMSIPHKQITQKNGWVEHDPVEILSNIIKCLGACDVVDAIGLGHQGESVVAWNSETKQPIYNAIVWQDLRTEDTIQSLKDAGLEPAIKALSGLPLDTYFSASKLGWIMKNIPEAQKLLQQNKLRLGTMDTFFIDALCGVYVTDYNSASRTSLLNIQTLEWDKQLCEIFGVPIEALPSIQENIGNFGYININGRETPITAVIVDQFAGTYGHGCREKGDTKITFGTGAFMQSIYGFEVPTSNEANLLPTLCWKFPGEEPVFGLDGGVYNAASAINWAKKIGLFSSYEELAFFKEESAISKGLAFVPALSGLGCPYWDRSAAGLWAGLSLETDKTDMMQSLLEGIAVRSAEVVLAMDSLCSIGSTIHVDGGLSANRYFLQFLSNLLQKNMVVPENSEITAKGIAFLARKGLGVSGELSIKEKNILIQPNGADMTGVLGKYKEIIQRSTGLRK